MTEENQRGSDSSSRSFLKNATLATTALAVGAGATANTAVAQTEDDAVVPGRNYYPDADFEVVSQFDSSTRDDILESYDDEFEDLGDWEAYAIAIDVGGSASVFGYLFIEEDETEVSVGDTGTFEEDASFRNQELNLVEVDPDL